MFKNIKQELQEEEEEDEEPEPVLIDVVKLIGMLCA